MKFRLQFYVVTCLVLILPGCEGLGPTLGGPPANLYTLTPKNTFSKELVSVSWQLVVNEPIASGGLNIDRIALRHSPTELKYFARARWDGTGPPYGADLAGREF